MMKFRLAVLSVIICYSAQAQFLKNAQVGFNIGQYVYQGDLTPNTLGSIKTSKTGFGFLLQKPINPYLAYTLNYNRARLAGNEALYSHPAYRQQRAFKFKSTVNELSTHLRYSNKPVNFNDYPPHFFVYAFAGLGLSVQNLKKDFSALDVKIFDDNSQVTQGLILDNTKPNFKILPFIPVGIGAEKKLSTKLNVFAELHYRIIFNDYVDGFSKAANPKLNDKYYSANIGVKYIFLTQNRNSCPSVL